MSDVSTDKVLTHYRDEAAARGLKLTSTMHDETTRTKEVDAILDCVRYAISRSGPKSRLLDVGCGNGYLLEALRELIPHVELAGSDYSPEMVTLARTRGISDCSIDRGDVRKLDYETASFDIVISERCVVNVLDVGEQRQALEEIARLTKPGGYYICVEAFVDGLTNLNRARQELGLDENKMPFHNRWFDPDAVLGVLGKHFHVLSSEEMERASLPPSNFLSSHYFVSRVVYPAITKAEVMYNTDFVRFFSFLEPRGNYSPIQLFLCRKLG